MLCRWCGTPVTAPRRRTFCSAACVHEYRIRSSAAYVKTLLYRRDGGVCASCGADTKRTSRQYRDAGLTAVPGRPHRRVWSRKWGGGCWDADHIVAVVNGGAPSNDRSVLFTLDRFQTLCIPCHVAKTARDVTLARSKRVELVAENVEDEVEQLKS